MVGILKILIAFFCVTFFIYAIKNYDYLKKKAEENQLFAGVLLGMYLIVAIVMISYSVLYLLYSLDAFEIIDVEKYLTTNNEAINNGVED